MSIRTRIYLVFIAIIAICCYFITDWFLDDVRPRYLEAVEESLVDTATILSSVVANEVGPENTINIPHAGRAIGQATQRKLHARIYKLLKTEMDLNVYITDKQGKVIYDSMSGRHVGQDFSRWNDVYRTLRGQYGARSTRVVPGDPSSSVLYVASPIVSNGDIIGVLTVCKPTHSINFFIDATKRKIVRATVTLAIVAVIVAFALSTWLTSPITRLTQYATAVKDGKRVELPELGNNEIGAMGHAIEEMRQVLEGKQYVENYVQNLTHELKSPISAIRGAAELLKESPPEDKQEKFIHNIENEAARLAEVVDRLLLLTSVESKQGLQDAEAIDLAALLATIVEQNEANLRGKDIQLELEIGPANTHGEPFLVSHAIENLLVNAIAFTAAGDGISIRLSARNESVQLEIENMGPPIPDYAQVRIFERFYSLPRPDSGQKSTGLGLSLVKTVAELHGGQIAVDNTETGVKATLTLPLV